VPSTTAIVRKDNIIGGPKFKFVGNIDDEMVQKPPSEFLEGFGPKHFYDRSSQKNKIRKPSSKKG
jgi:hypothetical protein